jgi:hypothetical protein
MFKLFFFHLNLMDSSDSGRVDIKNDVSADFRSIDSEKNIDIFESVGIPVEESGGKTSITSGGVVSAGPPPGARCTAHPEKQRHRRYIVITAADKRFIIV